MKYSKLFVAGVGTIALGGCFTVPANPAGPKGAAGYTRAVEYTGATGNTGAVGFTGGVGYDWIHGRNQ